jgi:mono/diheme cytochrome c family protein
MSSSHHQRYSTACWRHFSVRRVRCAASLVALSLALGGCEKMFTTFTRQPKVEPWESNGYNTLAGDSLRPYPGNPQTSVPVYGSRVPGYAVSYQPLPATVDSMSGLQNPTPPGEASLTNGRKYFSINCAVCHGDRAAGDGPATKYGMPGINLQTPVTQNRTDGYIYGMIRNGRGLMPSYNRIEDLDRWDVVNYLRGLEGRLGAPVPTGPLGTPGQTGATVPGYTETAPTRPVPYFHSAHRGGAQSTRPAGQSEPSQRATPTPGASATPAPAPAAPDSTGPTGESRP